MTGSMPCPPIFSLPTPAQLALALLVLKSKPIESSLEDYITQLRLCVQSGSRLSAKHLESCAFWKQAYERSEAAHVDLLNKHHELGREVEQMRNNLRQPHEVGVQAGPKRKRSVNLAAAQSTSCKRTSTGTKRTGMKAAHGLLGECISDLDNSEKVVGSAFARHFFTLRQLIAAKGSDFNALATSLKRTCAAADEMLSNSIEPFVLPIGKSAKTGQGQAAIGDLSRVTHALKLSYPSLLQAVEKSIVKANPERCEIYAVVRLFQNFLGHLHATAAKKAATTNGHARSTRAKRPRTAEQQSRSTSNFEETCMLLTRLAIHFFESLDLSQLSHNKVLEGLVCVFLDHLGSSLSLIVFANVDDAAPKATQLGVLPPRGLLDTSDLDQDIAVRTTKHEACYLVSILRHLMLSIDRQQSLLISDSAPLLTMETSLNISNSAFAARVRDKLQSTLLRGVFGDHDECIKGAFRRPVASAADGDIGVASDSRKETGEWFIGEVWNLLGWNTLTRQHGT